ncbi:hypothetical protein EW146_g10113 [Bondarzewia mesenterica]|uniref:Protein-lysine N-methyltransferase EFM6 n=1 Tax=Bondarzewia mesenterica TaxID=1095465 RepID=A0A4V3XC72_9AGAM|nr:hypothetical protein EW146_g10113 [Bondarzewia mesenterica]
MSTSAVLAQQEALDLLDPLRPLRHPHFDDDDDPLLPAQPPSIPNETTHLAFPLPPFYTAADADADAPPGPTSIHIKLAVDPTPGCGGVTWPAGEVLARYLARRGPRALAGKNVLELGSGTGLVGLVAALLGARVCITDQAPLIPLIHRNVALNRLSPSLCIPAELNWGDPLPASLPRPLHLILAADCVYFEPAFPLLVHTLTQLVPTPTPPDLNAHAPDPEILFCYKKRRKADKRFFALLKKHFTWTDVRAPFRSHIPGPLTRHTIPPPPLQVIDDPNRASYARETISLLTLRRKR